MELAELFRLPFVYVQLYVESSEEVSKGVFATSLRVGVVAHRPNPYHGEMIRGSNASHFTVYTDRIYPEGQTLWISSKDGEIEFGIYHSKLG